jgi:hypothetical protein
MHPHVGHRYAYPNPMLGIAMLTPTYLDDPKPSATLAVSPPHKALGYSPRSPLRGRSSSVQRALRLSGLRWNDELESSPDCFSVICMGGKQRC